MPYINCKICGTNYHDRKVVCSSCGEPNDWFMSDDDYMQEDEPYGMDEDYGYDNLLDEDN